MKTGPCRPPSCLTNPNLISTPLCVSPWGGGAHAGTLPPYAATFLKCFPSLAGLLIIFFAQHHELKVTTWPICHIIERRSSQCVRFICEQFFMCVVLSSQTPHMRTPCAIIDIVQAQTQPTRYSAGEREELVMDVQTVGTRSQFLAQDKFQIISYTNAYGQRPPGNLIYRS